MRKLKQGHCFSFDLVKPWIFLIFTFIPPLRPPPHQNQMFMCTSIAGFWDLTFNNLWSFLLARKSEKDVCFWYFLNSQTKKKNAIKERFLLKNLTGEIWLHVQAFGGGKGDVCGHWWAGWRSKKRMLVTYGYVVWLAHYYDIITWVVIQMRAGDDGAPWWPIPDTDLFKRCVSWAAHPNLKKGF